MQPICLFLYLYALYKLIMGGFFPTEEQFGFFDCYLLR